MEYSEVASDYTVVNSAAHSLHEVRTAKEFVGRFELVAGCTIDALRQQLIVESAQYAMFLVGSIPLGIGASSSDIDLLILVNASEDVRDSKRGLQPNTAGGLAFRNETDALQLGTFLLLRNGLPIDVTVVLGPAITGIQRRLRRRGPSLSDIEIMTLGRLATGWLLCESEGYLRLADIVAKDPALNVYCCTKYAVLSFAFHRKAVSALLAHDLTLALHMGRASVEMTYQAFLASEGMSYLGVKWPSRITRASDLSPHEVVNPLLRERLPLLCPPSEATREHASQYLHDVGQALLDIRALIERKTLFRIAFAACPQLKALRDEHAC